MKNAKLVLALLAGFSIALIFGFTKDGQVKKARKHASINAIYNKGIYLISSEGVTKELPHESGIWTPDKNNRDAAVIHKAMNDLEEQGYELVSTNSNGAVSEYLFREKEAK